MKKKLILIRGLGHSGTTILDTILGKHSSIVGIGEGIRVLRGVKKEKAMPKRLRSKERYELECTCDNLVPKCNVWGKTIEHIINNDEESLDKKFNYLSNKIYKNYGNEILIVDSSQSDLNSTIYFKNEYEIKVILLTKDIRSWVNSYEKKYNRSILRNVLTWYFVNKKIEKFLKINNLDYLKIGYEEFALHTEEILQKIFSWLKIDNEKNLLSLSKSKSHIVAGNRMRLNKSNNSKIIYDSSWKSRKSNVFRNLLFRLFYKRNNELVYSNINKKIKF